MLGRLIMEVDKCNGYSMSMCEQQEYEDGKFAESHRAASTAFRAAVDNDKGWSVRDVVENLEGNREFMEVIDALK